MLITGATAEVKASPAVEDAVVISAITPAELFDDAVAAAVTAPSPLAAVAEKSVTFSAEEANVAVALVPSIDPIPAISSSWSNAIPMDVNCTWKYAAKPV